MNIPIPNFGKDMNETFVTERSKNAMIPIIINSYELFHCFSFDSI